MANYYVAKSGNDSNDGLTVNTAKKTITAGVALLDNQGGARLRPDTLFIRGGTYDESFSSTWIHNDGANSYDLAKTIAAYNPGSGVEPVIIAPTSGQNTFNFSYSSQRYIILQDLILDGGQGLTGEIVKVTFQASDGSSNPSGFITLLRCEIKNGLATGVIFDANTAAGAYPNRAINCVSHDNGTDTNLHHGFYVASSGNLVERCTSRKNKAYGIHGFHTASTDVSNNTIRYNTCFLNSQYGILIGSGSNNKVYYNLCYNNNGGIRCDFGPGNGNIIDNNTCYQNLLGPGGAGSGILVGNASGAMTRTFVRNNIVANNAANYTDLGTNTTFLNTRQTAGNDGMAANFWLTQFTPLADRVGNTILEYTQDIIGTPVPQNPLGPSRGAFEWVPDRVPSLSVTAVGDGSGNSNSILSNLKGPLSYTTGGFGVDAAQLGLAWIDYAHASATAYLGVGVSKQTPGKFPSRFINLIVYQPNSGPQVPAGTNLSNRYFKIWAIGR